MINKKLLKVKSENERGLNTIFTNLNTGRSISSSQAIEQIQKGNPTYSDYHIVNRSNGTVFIRSNPDKSIKNNIE